MTTEQLELGKNLQEKIKKIQTLRQIAARLRRDGQWKYVIEEALSHDEQQRLEEWIVRKLDRYVTAHEVQLHTL